ncbi:otopetrin-3 [Lingula anatina]|uniref:Otopetrin-3 n=1 Tax=Lingula anatina TaxID=7574 RepID=A0A1S3IJ42_LINAN|nr:otopetrin-3 [Lingula anatina]|eukprot:XP_013398128.1 otopetrin-3 [Lingula anatina]
MEHQRKCFSIVLPQIQEESFSDESTGNCENPKESSTDPETGAGSIPRPKSLPLIKNLNENPEPESPLATTEKVHFNIGSSELGPEAGHPARGYDIQGGVHTPEEPVSNGSAFVGFNRNKHVSSIRSVASERSIATTVFEPNWSEEREHTYVNNHCGLFVGMLVILASVAVIIVFLYLMYNGKSPDLANSHLFGTKIFINALSILVTIATHIQIKGLMKKTDNLKEMGRLGRDPRRHVPSRGQQHQQSMDKALLGIATLGLLTYCMLTIIAGLSTAGMEAALTTADAFCTSTQAIIQSLFLVTSFLPRRATLREHREKRPGRQGLVFLLCCNFCLWALNSFGLRNEIANHVQIEFYSFKTWIILSHVSLPLLILFRFHSLVCIADVISHAYTAKYIGLESHGT